MSLQGLFHSLTELQQEGSWAVVVGGDHQNTVRCYDAADVSQMDNDAVFTDQQVKLLVGSMNNIVWRI